MPRISNERIAVECAENGRGIVLRDLARGEAWALDEESIVYGSDGQDRFGNPAGEKLPLLPVSAAAESASRIAVVYRAGAAELRLRYELADDHVEAVLPADLDPAIAFASLPGSFAPAASRARYLLPVMQGMLWDGRGRAWDWLRGEAGHQGFSMAFIGCLGEKGGLLSTAESRDDCRWWTGKAETGRYWAANIQIASLDSMRYERRLRIYFTDPEIAAVAKRYRRRVIERGEFMDWEEKFAARPGLERIFGSVMCYIGYCEDNVDYLEGCKRLKEYGFDRAFLYPGRFNVYDPSLTMGGVPAIDLPSATVEAIQGLGYDMAPWSWLMEAMDDGSDLIRGKYRKNRSGDTIKHWRIDEQQWYLVCHSLIADYQRRAMKGSISDMSWDHFDVLSCMPPLECYAKEHPAHLGRPSTRGEDRESIREVFRATQAAGRAVSSESFNDAYIKELDFGSVKAFPQYGPWPFWPIPLTMLVYHDSMIHSWYELHSYNNQWRGRTTMNDDLFEYGGGRPRQMAALDALMGCPPDVFPFGAQYGYSGDGTKTFLYKYRFEDPEVQLALKAALPVARLHRRIGKQEMVDFRFLSPDGYVQESTFADGTRIVANFSRDFIGPETGIDHKIVPGSRPMGPESWMALE
jgi:hypothetical protein